MDPQIVVGLLVDRTGFPLEIHAFPGNKAETQTIIPVVKAFQERNQVADMVVVADAGMLSVTNLEALDQAGLRFIVGSRMTKAPDDLATYFHHHEEVPDDGALVDTVTMRRGRPDPERVTTRNEPVWSPAADVKQWRAVWQYRRKRAVRDHHTLGLQQERAQGIIDGNKPAKSARYLQTRTGISIKALVKLLRPLRQVTISIGGHELIAEPQIPKPAQEILTKLKTA